MRQPRPTRTGSVGPGAVACGLVALALVAGLVSCGGSERSAGPAEGISSAEVTSGADAASRLQRAIRDEWQGVQLDVYGGGDPAPGGTTTMLVQHGRWAAELYWKTDGWCLSRVYDWAVSHAVTESRFDVQYRVVQEHDDCVMGWGTRMVLAVDQAAVVDGRATWSGSYRLPAVQPTVRTQCSADWQDPAPCGFADAAELLAGLETA